MRKAVARDDKLPQDAYQKVPIETNAILNRDRKWEEFPPSTALILPFPDKKKKEGKRSALLRKINNYYRSLISSYNVEQHNRK